MVKIEEMGLESDGLGLNFDSITSVWTSLGFSVLICVVGIFMVMAFTELF